MKITLVQPSMKIRRKEFYGVAPPLGLCYIAAVLEQAGHSVNIIDGMVEAPKHDENGYIRVGVPVEELAYKISALNPDVVGISCMYSFIWEDVSRVSAAL